MTAYQRWTRGISGKRRVKFSFPITAKCLVDGAKALKELGNDCTRNEFISAMIKKQYHGEKRYTKVLARDTWGAMRRLGMLKQIEPDIQLTTEGKRLANLMKDMSDERAIKFLKQTLKEKRLA